jgi:hypothetical protein
MRSHLLTSRRYAPDGEQIRIAINFAVSNEDADDKLQRRYLKLKRRMVIKANNRSREK